VLHLPATKMEELAVEALEHEVAGLLMQGFEAHEQRQELVETPLRFPLQLLLHTAVVVMLGQLFVTKNSI
jgi:hypothetical protein